MSGLNGYDKANDIWEGTNLRLRAMHGNDLVLGTNNSN